MNSWIVPKMKKFNRPQHIIELALASFIALLLIWFGADGVRGSDQYNYVVDVERIVQGAPLITNTFFPGPILRSGTLPAENHITHNGPMLYVVAFFAKSLTTYTSWIVVNTLCHLIVAYTIFAISIRYTEKNIASSVTALYLVSPIAIWQALNPLLEMYFSTLVAVVLLLFLFRKGLFANICLFVVLMVGVMSHPIFLVPAIAVGFVWLYEIRHKKNIFLFVLFVGYYFCIYFFLINKNVWFPSSFPPDLAGIVASAVPNKSNMFWFFSEQLPAIDSQLIYDKFVSALRRHTVEVKHIPMYVFTNIAILAAAILTLFNFKRWFFILIPTGIFGSQYIAMIILQQNHPRFQQIVAVVTFVLLAIAFFQWRNTRVVERYVSKYSFRVLWILVVLASGYMVNSAKNYSLKERDDLGKIALGLKQAMTLENARLVAADIKPHSPFSYAARPNDVLFFRTGMLDNEQIGRAMAIFDPHYIVSTKDSEFSVRYGAELETEWESSMYGHIVLYKALR